MMKDPAQQKEPESSRCTGYHVPDWVEPPLSRREYCLVLLCKMLCEVTEIESGICAMASSEVPIFTGDPTETEACTVSQRHVRL